MSAVAPEVSETQSSTAEGEMVDSGEELIAGHEGDLEAAIRTLMQDYQRLMVQLALTEAAMSKGFTRGWVPGMSITSEPRCLTGKRVQLYFEVRVK